MALEGILISKDTNKLVRYKEYPRVGWIIEKEEPEAGRMVVRRLWPWSSREMMAPGAR